MLRSYKRTCYTCALLWTVAGCSGEEDAGRQKGELLSSQWASYGHDGMNTRHNPAETIISRENVAQLVKKWDSVATGVSPHGVTSTPAVVDGVVYFGDWGGFLHAVDAKDGKAVWSTQLAPTTTGLNAQLNASPYVSADRVYLGGTENRLYAVDRATGKKVWDPHAVIGDEPMVILWSSPNVVDDTLIIGVGSFQVFLPGPYTFRGNVVGVDTDDGSLKWTTYVTEGNDESGFGCSIWGSAAIDRGRKWAFLGVGQAYSAPASGLSDSVVALDYVTGELKWGHQFTENDIFTITQNGEDFDVGASVILYEAGGKELVGAGDKGGHFYALERDSGALVWGTMLTPGGRTGGIMASPAVADGVIYVISNDGISENIGSDGPASASAFALDGSNGDVLWERTVEPGVFGGVAVANGLMFFTTLDGRIHALDMEDGEALWSAELIGGVASAASGVSVADGMVYAGAGWAWTPLTEPPPGGVVAFGLP